MEPVFLRGPAGTRAGRNRGALLPNSIKFYLNLVGVIELHDHQGTSLSLPTRKTVLVLAMLALESGLWSRQRLARAVWEGADPVAARKSLRTSLSALRKILGPQAINGQGASVAIEEGLVEVVLDGEGDFMPEFENEWAIDKRLRLRAGRVEAMCAAARIAWEEGRRPEALDLVDRACRADSLDADASKLRIEFLMESGRKSESISADRAYRRRVVRELGYVPTSALPQAVPDDNPLVTAVEWALDRDPEEALALLAATPSQWLAISVEKALDVHRRVLRATKGSTSDRRRVESMAWHLAVTSGGLGDRLSQIETHYQDAIFARDFVAAGRFCDALTYACLSCGEFRAAISFGQEGVRAARARDDRVAVAVAENTLAIVELHCLDLEGSVRRSAAAIAIIEDCGTPITIMQLRSSQIGSLIESGQIERAADRIEEYRRQVVVHGSSRCLPWVFLAEGHLHEKIGDMEAALASYEKLGAIADDAGQCAVAMADDGLMRVNCALRNDEAASEARGRVVAYRLQKRSVASPFERAASAPALRALQERGGGFGKGLTGSP